MQRYFIEGGGYRVGDTVALNSEDSYHLIKVMRAKVETEIWLVDEQQQAYSAKVVQAEGKAAFCQIMTLVDQTQRELPLEVTIACGLSKNDKLDFIVQKATECGMATFMPLSLTRDVVKWEAKKASQRTERLQKIAKEAAEQSHRVRIPTIEPLQNLTAFCQRVKDDDLKLIAYEETAKAGEHTQLAHILATNPVGKRLVVVFGSEGGLSEGEVEQLEQAGFVRCSLGPRILRAETAPIYLLSAVSYALELASR